VRAEGGAPAGGGVETPNISRDVVVSLDLDPTYAY